MGGGELAVATSGSTDLPRVVVVRGGRWAPTELKAPADGPDVRPTVAPAAGDDETPPNAAKESQLNVLGFALKSTAGWSGRAPATALSPTAAAYDVAVQQDEDSVSASVRVQLEYSNFNAGQSMMINCKLRPLTLAGADKQELVKTEFQDLVDGKWIPIGSEIAYTETATATVDAVIESSTAGQTAGLAKTSKGNVDLTFGPFGSRGRIILTFRVPELRSYDAMDTAANSENLGKFKLVPVIVGGPWSPVSEGRGSSTFDLCVSAPKSATVLSPEENGEVYAYFDDQLQDSHMVVAGALEDSPSDSQRREFKCHMPALPVKSTAFVSWIVLENRPKVFGDFEDIAKVLSEDNSYATLHVPAPADLSSLTVSMPGPQPDATLVRLDVQIPAGRREPDDPPRLLVHFCLSDASGSTSMSAGRSSVREQFNEMEIMRIRRRLQSLQPLVDAGVVRPTDVWMDVFVSFTHVVSKKFVFVATVADILAAKDLTAVDPPTGKIAQQSRNPIPVLSLSEYLNSISRITPGGGTCFRVAFEEAEAMYPALLQMGAAVAGHDSPNVSTVFDFDTDGGDNFGDPCTDNVAKLVDTYNVMNGTVLGCGRWVDQATASRVARQLGNSPALLALELPVPGSEGHHQIFRATFSAWIEALRAFPTTLTVHAGPASYEHPRRGPATTNMVDVLGAELLQGRGKLVFGPPDVTDTDFTAACIRGATGGSLVRLYLATRADPGELAKLLTIADAGSSAFVPTSTEPESISDVSLGHLWLKFFTGKLDKVQVNQPALPTHLSSRMEDDLSFSFQIASPSGATAYAGRAKTLPNRPAIDAAHRAPKVGELNLRQRTSRRFTGMGIMARSARPMMTFSAMPRGSSFGSNRSAYGSDSSDSFLVGRSAPRMRSVKSAAPPPPPSGGFLGGFLGAGRPSPPTPSPSAAKPLKKKMVAGVMRRRSVSSDEKQNEPEDLRSVSDILDATEWLKGDSPTRVGTEVAIQWASDHISLSKSLTFHCDQCHTKIDPSMPRYECLDCDDFDECQSCFSKNSKHDEKHVFAKASGSASAPAASEKEDPLVDAILGKAPTPKQAADSDNLGPSQRFLFNRSVMLHALYVTLFWGTMMGTTPVPVDALEEAICAVEEGRKPSRSLSDKLKPVLEAVKVFVCRI